MILERILVPSSTTAAAVSSQDVSIARILISKAPSSQNLPGSITIITFLILSCYNRHHLFADLQTAFERLVPQGLDYQHNNRWGDGNGHAHVRASLLGASMMVPFAKGRPLLGTWQQVVLIDFDNRPRTREIIVQIVGE
jgi:secondary thiamine-phosphate synthase enzyme